VLGNKGFVSNYFVNKDPNFNYGIPSLLLENTRPYTAVTAACLLINSKKHKEIGGFDENFKIAFNDIDYCLKLNKLGYFNICLKQSVLIHHESTSLGRPNEVKRDIKIFSNEIKMLRDKWGSIVDRDSFMNKNYELLEGKLHVRRI
jgi:GT2 family glycosyltransferase